MRPVLFHLGPFPIYAYGTMILVAFLVGLKITASRFRARGMPAEVLYDMVLIAVVAGILGARLFHIAQYRHNYDWTVFNLFEGIYWPGAVIGAVFCTGSRPFSSEKVKALSEASCAAWVEFRIKVAIPWM